eukprot:11044106-Alexandrium_andersonii.AAC.1
MSASLVGSEMCIRDSVSAVRRTLAETSPGRPLWRAAKSSLVGWVPRDKERFSSDAERWWAASGGNWDLFKGLL